MPNLRGASPVGRGRGSRLYVARAASKVSREMLAGGQRGRRSKERDEVGGLRAGAGVLARAWWAEQVRRAQPSRVGVTSREMSRQRVSPQVDGTWAIVAAGNLHRTASRQSAERGWPSLVRRR